LLLSDIDKLIFEHLSRLDVTIND